MKLVFKLGIILVLAALIATPIADATGSPNGDSRHKYTKTVKKEFPINSYGTTSLQNKYGKIDVKTWDKNRVKISALITVEANSESQAQNAFNRIKIDFANDQNVVKASTMIEAQKNSIWANWNEEKTEFSINYTVFMPKSGSLILGNKYGDSFVESIGGNAEVNVHYGKFYLEGVGKDLSITMNYAEGTVVQARDVIADVSNCKKKLRIKKAHDVILTSKNSRISIETGKTIKVDSRNDFFNLGNIDKLKFQGRYGDVEVISVQEVYAHNSRYSDFYIEKLKGDAELDLQFGGVIIEKIGRGFSEINLYGKHTDFKITVEPGSAYKLNAEAKSAGITYPDNFIVDSERDNGVSHLVNGHRGSGGGTINAIFEYGGLRVQ